MKNDKVEKKYDRNEKILYCLFEIFTLVLSIISFSFIVGCLSGEIETVSAEGIRCCVQAKDGSMCQEYGTRDCANECEEGCIPTECAAIPDCATGCCFDKTQGYCSPNSMLAECEEQGGAWHPDASCDINECKQGCCILGTESAFVTRTRCNQLSELNGIESKFKEDIDELTCYAEAGKTEMGACITGEDVNEKVSCKFTTQADCLEVTGSLKNFKKNYLCSHPELNTICKAQHTTGCVEGRDEVYWFDSCGNRENIYSSNKQQSYNSGKVLEKQKSCNPSVSNANSETCGNCNYELGGVCSKVREGVDKTPKDGDYICRDLNCYDAPKMSGTQDRINGESWCVYDGIIGLGKDLVGSRHFRYVCVDGETEVEPCADFRQEICVQDSKTLDNGREIDEAMCRVNMWEDCFTKNTEEGCKEDCRATCVLNPDCMVYPVRIDKDFEFAICVPKFPSGFEFDSGILGVRGASEVAQVGLSEIGLEGVDSYTTQQENVAAHICAFGSQTCTYVEVKGFGGWKCDVNCACKNELETASVKMNDLCVSLGDCGIYSNYKGTTTIGGFMVSGAGIEGSIIGAIAPAVFEKMVGKVGELISSTETGGEIMVATPGFYEDIDDIDDLPMRGISQMFGYSMGGSESEQSEGGFLGMFKGPTAGTAFMLTGAAGLAGAGAAAAIASSLPGAGGGNVVFTFLGQGGFGFTTAVITWAVVAIVVAIVLMKILGIGDTREVEVDFQCLPWTQPTIRGDCDYCNEDPYKPCSPYRCESLGTRCVMVNDKSEEYGACVDKKGEDTVPTIIPWKEALNTSMFKYVDANTNGFQIRAVDGECVPAFSIVGFGIETDVYASCVIATDKEMNNARAFLEGNHYTKNHSMIVSSFPSADSVVASLEDPAPGAEQIKVNENTREEIESLLKEINLYVKCKNIDGEENEQDFKINICVDDGPDLTPPLITAVSPAPESYVPYNATEKLVKFIVSEPSDCKWGESVPVGNPDEKFDSLENKADCEQDVYKGGIFGFECNMTVPIGEDETDYYIMCKDQPWIEDGGEDGGEDGSGEGDGSGVVRNIGNVFKYNLKRSLSELKILSIEPSGEIDYGGAEFPKIELLVATEGGSNNGISTCEFSFDEKNYTEFFETRESNHKQVFTSLESGQNQIYVKCEDNAGNVALGQTNFQLAKDDNAPIVTRTYGSHGSLIIETNENALCYYQNDSLQACNFKIANVSSTSGIATTFHEIPWNTDITYYIKCVDGWGNMKEDCSIIVKPYREMTS